MKIDHNNTFQRMIDESLAGVLSSENERSLREHLSTCAACGEYLAATNRVIAGLSDFSFEGDPTLKATVLAALKLRAEERHGIPGHNTRTRRQLRVPWKNWAAWAVALSMSSVGSLLVYRMAERLTVPGHLVSARVQAGVLVFWLLPSLCAAFCLLAAPGKNRVMA